MEANVRYQVFVSSTYRDLADERQAVMSALLQLGAHPAGMELFPAANDEAWTLIQRIIDESDYYLLVVGGRYGSMNLEGLSFTEKEYDYASAQAKPIMAFLHAEPDNLPVKASEREPELRAKLDSFRAKVERARHVKYWDDAKDLAGKVALSFHSFTRAYPMPGWVRGDSGDRPETIRRLSQAMDRVSELEAEIRDQATRPPLTAQGLADGDQVFEFETTASASIRNLVAGSDFASTQEPPVDCSITWNQILAALGPLMIDEARQFDLQRRFEAVVNEVNRNDVEERVSSYLQQIPKDHLRASPKGKSVPHFTFSIKVPIDAFETALLQLEALGLIERGTRKRQVADRSTYWTLTPWGRNRLRQSRAVRTGDTSPPSLYPSVADAE